MIINIGDKYKRIVDVMNECFGWNYKACMKGYYELDNRHEYATWFPKLAISDDGRKRPGDKWHGWVNTMSDDGNYIYMNNYDEGWRMEDKGLGDGPVTKHITFIRRPKDDYEYAGVFICVGKDHELGCIFKKIDDAIDPKALNLVK